MASDAPLMFRDATADDLPELVALLADDFLGTNREAVGQAALERYAQAFLAIEASPDNRLIVAVRDGAIAGTFQLTFIPGLSFSGGTRAQVEAVRVAAVLRGQGVGKQMIAYGIEAAKRAGCCMVQLTMNKQRTETLRFYQGLGFEATHEGFKLML